ncbi:2-keto-4-pentenoate hydratase [Bradyrhizobium sp.]|jgi:2-keto-4-pentenoate hydratase|uniref:2-keto-4-pentenoate hydratase n=1 Tax=Bradyrhizobium sp. TaxID=376 RepID=UPI002D3CE597|nr:fumarylacetoacetate hydrolase family protein [Bradyrhizobium sp.]HZR72296.1 fumarylacetoacetate hydrolase family protein [Bradyrhizobium sp.]
MSSNVERAAATLREARSSRRQIAPIAATYGLGSIDEAYAVAALNTAARLAEGRRVIGRKIGLTAESVQRQLGVDQPDFGVLFDDMELLDRDTVPAGRLMQPKVEAEIAFVIGCDLQRRAPSWGEFVSAIGYALPALEIVDSAIADWKIGIVDTVADNASAGLYVLGDQPVSLGLFQLAAVEAVLTCNGTVVSQGRGSACLGHPLRAAYWLACEIARRGEGMRAGEIILSGALGPTAPVKSGDLIEADFGDFGRVACRFA